MGNFFTKVGSGCIFSRDLSGVQNKGTTKLKGKKLTEAQNLPIKKPQNS